MCHWQYWHNETCSYIKGMIKNWVTVTEKHGGKKVIKRAHCFQSARMSLSFDHVEFRPFRWLECVGQASNAFLRHHHNSCHSWGSASCADICTTTLVTSVPFPRCLTEANTHTYAHTELHQLNASRANQKGIRDGCCLQTPMCGWVWMGPKGGEVSDTTGYQQGWHIAWPDRACCDAWRVGRVTNPRFSTSTIQHSLQACYTTVTWVG